MVSIIFRFCYRGIIVANNHTSKAFNVERPISIQLLSFQHFTYSFSENVKILHYTVSIAHKDLNTGDVLMLYNALFASIYTISIIIMIFWFCSRFAGVLSRGLDVALSAFQIHFPLFFFLFYIIIFFSSCHSKWTSPTWKLYYIFFPANQLTPFGFFLLSYQ